MVTLDVFCVEATHVFLLLIRRQRDLRDIDHKIQGLMCMISRGEYKLFDDDLTA